MAKQVRIRRGDTVEVINGTDKGARGEVIRVIPKHGRLVVQGVAMRKKHQRQVQAGGRMMNPGIIQFEAPIDVSNVMLVCPKCKEKTRVSIVREDGDRVRICKKCETKID
jgi:large subunit ribosomal protein L24